MLSFALIEKLSQPDFRKEKQNGSPARIKFECLQRKPLLSVQARHAL